MSALDIKIYADQQVRGVVAVDEGSEAGIQAASKRERR